MQLAGNPQSGDFDAIGHQATPDERLCGAFDMLGLQGQFSLG